MYTDVKRYNIILLLSLTVPVVKADRDVVGWVRVFLAVSKEGHKLIILGFCCCCCFVVVVFFSLSFFSFFLLPTVKTTLEPKFSQSVHS